MILKFIKEFSNFGQQVIDCFTCGNCYWFAVILINRFRPEYLNDCEIVYAELDNHFGCRLGDTVYDITGDVTENYAWEPWVDMYQKDEALAARIVRDCINK